MAYIGRQLVRGQNRVLDDISGSFNGSTTAFNLTVSSTSTPPASVNQLWIILGGVLQKPGTDFTVADAVITFTTAPAAALSFWGMIQGDTSDINSPADASVTPSKIANSGDFAFPADVRFNDADGSHYVGLQAPSTVSSNLVWTLPAADGSANQVLKTDGSGALGWASDANAPEGTAVLSTGETGTTKYLRVDGDNTCSWQLAVDATKTTLTGSTNNTITTVTGANAIQGEANLTYDGTTLLSNADTAGLTLRDSSAYAGDTGCQISFQGKDSNEATKAFAAIKGLSVSADNGQLRLQTRTGGTLYDRLKIDSAGKVHSLNAVQSGGNTTGGFQFDAVDTACVLGIQQPSSGADTNAAIQVYDGTSNNLRINYSGLIKTAEGIQFTGQTDSTATNATTAVTTLDHYEEGTWTPTFNESVTMTLSHCSYVKIGKVVKLSAVITNPSATPSEIMRITGLPFGVAHSQSCGTMFGFDVNEQTFCTYINASHQLFFYGINSGGAWTSLSWDDLASGTSMYFDATYISVT